MFSRCRPREAIEKFAVAEQTQRNPHLRDGKSVLIGYIERMAREHPGNKVHFRRAIAGGD